MTRKSALKALLGMVAAFPLTRRLKGQDYVYSAGDHGDTIVLKGLRCTNQIKPVATDFVQPKAVFTYPVCEATGFHVALGPGAIEYIRVEHEGETVEISAKELFEALR